MEAYEHQEVPFEKVVAAVVKERDMSRSPLFQVMFVYQNASEIPALQLPQLTIDGEVYNHTTAKFDITIFVIEMPAGLRVAIEYSTELYCEQSIVRMSTHFKELLTSIVKWPNEKIALLPMLTNKEEHQLLIDFNDTKADYPKDKSIIDLFEEQVLKTPASNSSNI